MDRCPLTDANFAQDAYYAMSYRLGRTEDDVDTKKALDKAQAYYNMQDKREWVEWVGKMLMLCLHAQIAMEKADAERAEQDTMDEVRPQAERAQQEEEWVAKEAELDEKETEYIRQINTKKIDEDRFWELVAKLDLERAMGECCRGAGNNAGRGGRREQVGRVGGGGTRGGDGCSRVVDGQEGEAEGGAC
jgi:hypothetical protein